MNVVDRDLAGRGEEAWGQGVAGLCPSCGTGRTEPFYQVDDVPTNSCILFRTRAEAIGCIRGSILLHHCRGCGFVFNSRFEQALTEYSDRYEETQGFSPTFNRFHHQLAQEIVQRHGLYDRDVMEIGCGKGEFLVLLSQLGRNRGIGVDPSAIPERLAGVAGAELVTLIPEYFEPRHCTVQPDLLCCKMTLEHIPQTARFLETIRAGLDAERRATIFFQVPDAGRILRACAYEDIYYEHCSYFTEASLSRLFRHCGFDVIRTTVEYDGQYLTLEAVPSARRAERADKHPSDEWTGLVRTFAERARLAKEHWRSIVRQTRSDGRRILLWGSGSKAVSFLTSLGLADAIDAVTDINPNRHDHFMPGTGQPIISPARIAELDPGLVIVMNGIYEDEIRRDLAGIGVSCDVRCL
ncbi:Methyltransferase domain-containing protein [Sphingomonas laterariae]|uniref:Methyltransferase domain-containing protein n=1 Tax=Edaphosphingomonas laterariae TaxID=861865 RepID=A0A239ILL9_9SPHN|nr:class I SAM-dependent methyltransferase [Sphingomonas laterariae]SNS93943.1 Methyltransferase domain-containing protein [Sphingomonas laterariae]